MTHLDHLYRVAFYLVRNRDEAQDIVQETCVRAFDSHQQFTPGTNMKAWLTRILYNLFFDQYQRKKRMVSIDEKDDTAGVGLDYWAKLAGENPGPEKQLLNLELNAKIQDALGRIPEEFRAAIILVDMGDFSYAEAAGIMSCPIGTVRSRLSRGRRLLHEFLQEYVLQESRRGKL